MLRIHPATVKTPYIENLQIRFREGGPYGMPTFKLVISDPKTDFK